METLLSIIVGILILLFAVIMVIANANKDEIWEKLYKKLGLK
ncbi:MAG: hypothetical protein PHU05_04050 [Bacilli bacterium]|nr:hypothetical protein [Bacilli bacterium]